MGLPLAALLVLVVAAIVIGNVNLTSHLKQRREREQQTRQVSAHLQEELDRLMDTSRLEGPWNADPAVAAALAPFDTAVRAAQASLRKAMQEAGDVMYGSARVPADEVERAVRDYQLAFHRLREAWVAYDTALERLARRRDGG